ncbi:hypothetical protein [Sphingobacterium spiritivorum]|uniref:hypothetical protein n=1 Tax=Sphingobacterium spiritivorum TaxID=258 RepID=UPI003DA25612
MKIHNKKIFSFSLFVLCGFLILSSCNKKDAEKQISPDQVAQLAFTVNGIEEATDAAPSKLKASLAETPTDRESQLLQLGNMSAEVSVTSGPIKNQTAPANSKQRAANMTDGYKYRVVVVNATTGAVVGSVQATAKTDGSAQVDAAKIDVVKGGTYKWYAYSYNDANNVPVLPNEANPVFSPSYDKDLLIAQSTTNVTVPGTAGQGPSVEVQVPITFKHALAKVTVRFDASSRADQITVLNAALGGTTYFNTGSITLNTTSGALSYSPTQVTLPSATLFSINNTPSGNVVEKSFYTIPSGAAISNFQVNIANLTVGPLTASNKTVNFGNTIVPAAGKEMIANINIFDATLIGSVYWATGNLYYENGVYKIRDEDTTPRPLNYSFYNWYKTDGWNWTTATPGFQPAVSTGVDPCTKVSQSGTAPGPWRLPTKAEFQSLLDLMTNNGTWLDPDDGTDNNTNPRVQIKRNIAPPPVGYVRFRSDISKDKWAQFNFDGMALGIPNVGYYWTSELGTWDRAWALQVQNPPSNGKVALMMQNNYNTLNINSCLSCIINIRCVRK